MIVPRVIERKRDGGRLEPEEIRELVMDYSAGRVPDYQMSALLMAIYFQGLDRGEMGSLMEAMLESGKKLDLSRLRTARIDKHSTGGVGDKTSLILAPLVASLGVAVPMMSGRGLGHTGGTLDKLESIPGFRASLTMVEAERQIARLILREIDERLRFLDAKLLSKVRSEKSSLLDIRLNADTTREEQLPALEKLLRSHEGPCRVMLRMEIPKRSETILDLGDDYKVAASDELLARIEQIFGARVAVLR